VHSRNNQRGIVREGFGITVLRYFVDLHQESVCDYIHLGSAGRDHLPPGDRTRRRASSRLRYRRIGVCKGGHPAQSERLALSLLKGPQFHRSTPPLVIPTEAEGSAVLPKSPIASRLSDQRERTQPHAPQEQSPVRPAPWRGRFSRLCFPSIHLPCFATIRVALACRLSVHWHDCFHKRCRCVTTTDAAFPLRKAAPRKCGGPHGICENGLNGRSLFRVLFVESHEATQGSSHTHRQSQAQ
jgi:hypothetical protein